jgi:hypothetical protein
MLLLCGLLLPLLALRLGLLLLFRGLALLFPLVLLLRTGRNSDSEKQKQSRCTNHSNQFHAVASVTACSCGRHSS